MSDLELAATTRGELNRLSAPPTPDYPYAFLDEIAAVRSAGSGVDVLGRSPWVVDRWVPLGP